MAYDINEALLRLETNLKNLDSARKQVEMTVSESQNLQHIVENYVSAISNFF